jgi:hypothetical protein
MSGQVFLRRGHGHTRQRRHRQDPDSGAGVPRRRDDRYESAGREVAQAAACAEPIAAPEFTDSSLLGDLLERSMYRRGRGCQRPYHL